MSINEVSATPAPSMEWASAALDEAARSCGRITAVKRLAPQQRLEAVEAVQTYVAARLSAYRAAHAAQGIQPCLGSWINDKPELAAAVAVLNRLCIAPVELAWWEPGVSA